MAQQTDSGIFWLNVNWALQSIGPGNGTSEQINAAGEQVFTAFQIPKDGNIDKLLFWCTAVGTADDVEVSIQTLGDDGKPTGTNYKSGGTQTITPGANLNTVTFTTTYDSVVRGDRVGAVIDIPAGSTADISIRTFNGASADSFGHPGSFRDLNVGSWTSTGTIVGMAFEYDDGSYEDTGTAPLDNFTSNSYLSGSSPDERGILFQIPFPARLVKAMIYYRPFGSALNPYIDINVYKGTTLQGSALSLTSNFGTIIAGGFYKVTFPDAHSVAANEDWRVTVEAKENVQGVQLFRFDPYSAGTADAWGLPATFHSTTRTNGGSFTDTSDEVPCIALGFDGFDDGAGGGGGGARNPIVGPVW